MGHVFKSEARSAARIIATRPPPSHNRHVQSSAKIDLAIIRSAFDRARSELLSQCSPEGYWLGELSSSALSTATACTALAVVQRASPGATHQTQIQNGLKWLADHQNADGGWGDTTQSLSNISTTTLCWAALGALPHGESTYGQAAERAGQWLTQRAGGVDPESLGRSIIARYGRDRTFSVPILTMCALAGRLGAGRAAWRQVIPLPFELAALPHQFFAALRLPVVSYALPALIAIGQARHHHAPSRNPFARAIRTVTRSTTLRVLTEIQPVNGGFLEATPLTSFVTMSLAGSGQEKHLVARRGVEFLLKSQRVDGSWPIDTNLSTWVTTLAIDALAPAGEEREPRWLNWLLGQQYRTEHPYTHAQPGGWAWTNLPGGVPDADDTSGALLALKRPETTEANVRAAAVDGLQWLLQLQNIDGGIPTFCRGWGALPFDRSSADITAHAIRAWLAWEPEVPARLRGRLIRSTQRALKFIGHAQRSDGSWLPLWFGNEHVPDDENPTYGTARVLHAVAVADTHPLVQSPLTDRMCRRAIAWFAEAQNADGGWGGAKGVGSSTEETALAVEALAVAARFLDPERQGNLQRGVGWLVKRILDGRWAEPAPIGFYFAKLWYYEKLYPLIFTVGALRRVLELEQRDGLGRSRGAERMPDEPPHPFDRLRAGSSPRP